MIRFLPTVVGAVIAIAGFALSSGILTAVGGALVAAGVLWFVARGTGTHPDPHRHG